VCEVCESASIAARCATLRQNQALENGFKLTIRHCLLLPNTRGVSELIGVSSYFVNRFFTATVKQHVGHATMLCILYEMEDTQHS